MSDESDVIQARLVKFIQQYKEGQSSEYEVDFNQLAMSVFDYQFQNNLPYKKFAQLKHKNPLTVKNWQDLPLIPIEAYKQLTLSTRDTTQAEDVFYSSGTTNAQQKSRHYISDLRVWEQSMIAGFKQYVIPTKEKITIFSLFPDMSSHPNSSLSRYITTAMQVFGTENSQVFFKHNQLDYVNLISALKQAQANHEQVLVLGASFSYVHLLAYFDQHPQTFDLAEGSIIFDTGGFKGQSQEVSMSTLYKNLGQVFNVSREQIINMYGMTEISSQCYDRNLIDLSQNQSTYFDKMPPAWVKIQILDVETLQPIEQGKRGLLAYYDLANWDTCLAILTEDIAIQNEHGFTIIGRAKGSEAKGCSIAVDELLKVR